MSSFEEGDGRGSPSAVPVGESTAIAKEVQEDSFSGELSERERNYHKLLEDAKAMNLDDLERSGCVGLGCDNDGMPILIFVPQLGFARCDKSDETLRRMVMLFLRKADKITHAGHYSILYAHTTLSILSQPPLIYKYWKMLPREHKKHLQQLYVLHPTYIIRTFFEVGVRRFVSDKFYKKLHFFDHIWDFQQRVSCANCKLPHTLFRLEDEMLGLKAQPSGTVADLVSSYDPDLQTTPLIYTCIAFLRAMGLNRKGLFRVSGDEIALILVKTRVQQPSFDSNLVLIGDYSAEDVRRSSFNSDSLLGKINAATAAYTSSLAAATSADAMHPHFVRSSSVSMSSSSSSSSSRSSRKGLLSHGEKGISTVCITDVDTVAQVLKMLLRSLPTPLIPFDFYQPLLNATKWYQETKSAPEFEAALEAHVLTQMPPEHFNTLQNLLSFLCEVAECSQENSMDVENLSRIFAPTVMRSPTEARGGTGATGATGAGGAGGGAQSQEAMQMDLIRAAAELNLCKVSVELMLQRTIREKAASMAGKEPFSADADAASSAASSAGAGGGDGGSVGAEASGDDAVLGAMGDKMLARLAGMTVGRGR